jgi:hypothetical protein
MLQHSGRTNDENRADFSSERHGTQERADLNCLSKTLPKVGAIAFN